MNLVLWVLILLVIIFHFVPTTKEDEYSNKWQYIKPERRKSLWERTRPSRRAWLRKKARDIYNWLSFNKEYK